jgi:hypothetical protein
MVSIARCDCGAEIRKNRTAKVVHAHDPIQHRRVECSACGRYTRWGSSSRMVAALWNAGAVVVPFDRGAHEN